MNQYLSPEAAFVVDLLSKAGVRCEIAKVVTGYGAGEYAKWIVQEIQLNLSGMVDGVAQLTVTEPKVSRRVS